MKLSFQKSRRIRIIANDVAIYSTVGQYAATIATGWLVNAVLLCLLDLQANGGAGIVKSYDGQRTVQVDLL